MIDVYFTATTTEPEFINEPGPFAMKATNIYYAANSENFETGSSTGDRESISKFKDFKGLSDMIYRGVENPTIDGRPPFLRKEDVKVPYAVFLNRPYTPFATDNFSSVTGSSHAMTVVMEYEFGQQYEAFVPGFVNATTGDYFADSGGGIRAGNNTSFPTGHIPYMVRTVVHIEITQNKFELWLNGVYQSEKTNVESETNTQNKISNAVGVGTNNAPWRFMAMHQWIGDDFNYLRANRDAILSEICTDFYAGEEDDKPYALNFDGNTSTNGSITFNPNAENIQATYQRKNADGINVNSDTFLWCVKRPMKPGNSLGLPPNDDFANQQIIFTEKVLPQSILQQYKISDSDYFPATALCVYVSVGDTGDYVRSVPILLT